MGCHKIGLAFGVIEDLITRVINLLFLLTCVTTWKEFVIHEKGF